MLDINVFGSSMGGRVACEADRGLIVAVESRGTGLIDA